MSISISSLRSSFTKTLNRVASRGRRIVLTHQGKSVAALVPVEDLALLEQYQDRLDAEDADKVIRKMRRTGEKPVPLAKVARRIGL